MLMDVDDNADQIDKNVLMFSYQLFSQILGEYSKPSLYRLLLMPAISAQHNQHVFTVKNVN